MKIKLPPEKTNGNLIIYDNDPKERERLQKILDDKQGNEIRASRTNYYAWIKNPVDGWLNTDYLNSDTSNPDEIQI